MHLTTATPADARAHESRAADHLRHNRFSAAREEYRKAEWAWMAVAERSARHGETALTDIFRAEASKNDRKHSATFWLELEAREARA